MKRNRLCLWLSLAAVACSKVGADPVAPPAPPVYTIQAGFADEAPETRSRLDFEETQARVLWTRGDAFKMLAYSLEDGKLHGKTYTTQDDGVTQATFTSSSSSVLSGRYFVCGYPSSVFTKAGGHDTADDSFIMITPVPTRQQAVPGGLAEGLNRAVAWSDKPDADLKFHNMLSIVRFRLDGGIVPDVTSVVFDAGTTVAGKASSYRANGMPTIDFSHNWTAEDYPRSSTIALDGSFDAGTDYCLALVPATLPAGFNMYFCNAQGDTLYKHSSKPMTLGRSRIVDLGTICLGDSWKSEKPDVIEYVHQTKGKRKNVVAVLADGFTAAEQDKFELLAKSGVDYLFSVEPYKSYKEYFTVYLFRVPSNESGAGVLNGDVPVVDNAFGSRWSTGAYSDMTADDDKIVAFLKTHCPEVVSGELTYQDVPTLLLINDFRYGGICHIYRSGWTYAQVPYQYEGGSISWSFPKYQAVNERNDSEGSRLTTDAERDEMGRHVGNWRNTLLHEFGGHGYGRLTDEYWSETTKYTEPGALPGHSYTVPYALNVSGYYDSVPWQSDLLDHLDEWTDLNPDYGRIGIWHGAQTSLYYRWRSEKTSCMIDNRPYFSTWQRILIVRRIMEKAGETFDMDDFIAKDVTVDPIRPVVPATASAEERSRILLKARSQALLVPEMPMLPPPVEHLEEDF